MHVIHLLWMSICFGINWCKQPTVIYLAEALQNRIVIEKLEGAKRSTDAMHKQDAIQVVTGIDN